MQTEIEGDPIARRRLMVRDSLAILTLLLATTALFGVTLYLFRAFSAQRARLAQNWSEEGSSALVAGRPADAIVALRTALTYAPDTPAYELLLAEALGKAGRTDESTQYFMGLWEKEPGDGEINLQLARLAAQRKDRGAAVNFYRAATYGTWEGDGVQRRLDARLELARYLIANGDMDGARTELLTTGGDEPNSHDLDITLAGLLEQASDPTDAATYYGRAIAAR